PMMLVFDPSFQLSFLATYSLITISPFLEEYFIYLPVRLNTRAIVASSVAAQLMVTPLLLYSSGVFSVVALPANVLLTFAVPVTMLVCFITGLVGMFVPLLGTFLGYGAFLFLSYQLYLVYIFARVPFASVTFAYF